jgi:hypothetical protein
MVRASSRLKLQQFADIIKIQPKRQAPLNPNIPKTFSISRHDFRMETKTAIMSSPIKISKQIHIKNHIVD